MFVQCTPIVSYCMLCVCVCVCVCPVLRPAIRVSAKCVCVCVCVRVCVYVRILDIGLRRMWGFCRAWATGQCHGILMQRGTCPLQLKLYSKLQTPYAP